MPKRLAAVLVLGLIGCTAPTVPPTASPDATPSATLLPSPSAPPSPTGAPSPSSTPEPTVTALPTLTASPSPIASATRNPPTATPLADGIVVDAGAIDRHLDALAEIADAHDSLRTAGTSGYDASADYVAEQLEAFGYEVSREPIEFTFFDEDAPVALRIGDRDWSGDEWLHANIYSGEGDVSGSLETVGIGPGGVPTADGACEDSAWDEFESGKIALVMGGTCLRRDVVLLAQDAGATAVISLYPSWTADRILRPTLLDPAGIEIPAIVAGQEPALELLAAAEAGEAGAISVDVQTAAAKADNVFGELPGSSGSFVMIGGHLDSALDGPGLNDNGSGVAALLAIAESAAAQPDRTDGIRFGFWAAEEFGTVGSSEHVENLSQAERDAIEAYINLDMVGSPNAGRYVYDDFLGDGESGELTGMLLAAFEELDAPATGIPSGGSDHIAFWQVGITVGGVFSGIAPLLPDEAELFGGQAGVPADPCYHLACDVRSNVDTQTAATFGQAVATVLEELAF